MANTNYLYLLMVYPILLIVLFFIFSTNTLSFSAAAILQPYSAEHALISMVLGAAGLFYPLLYLLVFMPRFIDIPAGHLALMAMPELVAIFGFVIGFLNRNPWAALPFFVISLSLYAYAYLQVTAKQ